MQAPSWIALFEQIPATLRDCIAITIVTGADIMMQALLRIESDYAIIRGRMAGSTDAGRVIILPYDQIVNLAFTKRMLEPEVHAVFGEVLEGASANSGNPSSAGESAEKSDESRESAAGPPGSKSGVTSSSKAKTPTTNEPVAPAKNQPGAPSKSILLARLRARLAEQGK